MNSFTKTVTTTYSPMWVKKDFSTYNEEFIAIRKRFGTKFDTCFKCGEKYKLGDMVNICCFKRIGNKPLCLKCADFINGDAEA